MYAPATKKYFEEKRESELNQALQECSESLVVVRMRFERAFDSRAGDILCHDTCYFAGVTRCTTNYPQSPCSQTEVSEVSNKYFISVSHCLVTPVIETKNKIGTPFQN